MIDSVPAPTTTFVDASPPPGQVVHYRVSVVNTSGYGSGYSNQLTVGNPSSSARGGLPPADFLEQNLPNPFNPTTKIRFGMTSSGFVSLDVFDALGRRVKRLVAKVLPGGVHEVLWDGRNDRGRRVSAGVYFYRLETGSSSLVRKMVLVE